VVGESGHNHRAAMELQSMQDAFAALFFVAMGMLFDPQILIHSTVNVLVVVAIIVIGKPIATFFTLRLFRQSVSTALSIAPAFGQIGEFSFILAAVAVESRLMPVEGQSLIIAGALISIALNSFLIRAGEVIQARLTPTDLPEDVNLAVSDQ
jgi:monovalent cation:H+ antiporter-2, CPA2 family